MLQSIRPMLGDLMLDGVAVMGWLFILALMASAWWERRQTRIVCEWARGQKRRITPLRAFFKRFRGKLLLLTMFSVVVVILLRAEEKATNVGQEADNMAKGVAAYAANFHGAATRPVPAAAPSLLDDLWCGSVSRARTLNLAVGTNLFNDQDSTQLSQVIPAVGTNPTPRMASAGSPTQSGF